jgi:hypothetical protein
LRSVSLMTRRIERSSDCSHDIHKEWNVPGAIGQAESDHLLARFVLRTEGALRLLSVF